MHVIVHPRVIDKRRWLREEELVTTWMEASRFRPRSSREEPRQMMAVGWDPHGRLLEMIAYKGERTDMWVIFHAAPARKRFLQEMGFSRQQIDELIGRR